MNRNRLLTAIVIAVLVFSAFMIGNMGPRLTSIGKPTEQMSQRSLVRCGMYGPDDSVPVPSDLTIEGDKVVSGRGKRYVTIEITSLLNFSAPGPMMLEYPISVNGVTFTTSPLNRSVFYTLGFVYVILTFPGGGQRTLSVGLMPSIADTCVALTTYQDKEAGIVVLLSPTDEPDGPWVITEGDRRLRESVYAIVRV